MNRLGTLDRIRNLILYHIIKFIIYQYCCSFVWYGNMIVIAWPDHYLLLYRDVCEPYPETLLRVTHTVLDRIGTP